MLKSKKHPQKMSLRVFWVKRLKIHQIYAWLFYLVAWQKDLFNCLWTRLTTKFIKTCIWLDLITKCFVASWTIKVSLCAKFLVGLSNRVSLRSLSRRSKLRVYAFYLGELCHQLDNNLVYFYQNGDQSEPQSDYCDAHDFHHFHDD